MDKYLEERNLIPSGDKLIIIVKVFFAIFVLQEVTLLLIFASDHERFYDFVGDISQ
jgi:hypothetical protein